MYRPIFVTLPVDSAGRDAGRWRGALSPLATIVSALLASLFLLFLVAPLVGLVGAGGTAGVRQLVSDAELRGALTLTMLTATTATVVATLGGTPIAYVLARRRFAGRTLVIALLDLPLIVPHPVAGIALLLVLGRASPLGGILFEAGVRLTGSVFGIVCAMLFVAAPLYVGGAREAFTRVDRRYEAVARTLGDSAWTAFRRITVPLSLRGLTASAIVMWARAVSEFGAIVVLTYNPKVASVLSYDRFTTLGLSGALPVAAVLVLLAIIPLAALRALRRDE
jgi:molybdate/tungstate transport system permease protein